MKKILVTGACGFIGTNLCIKLLERGDEVYGLDNFSNDREYSRQNYKKLKQYKKFFLFQNFKKVPQIQYNAIIHYAANPSVHKSIEDPLNTHNTNLTFTLQVLEFAKKTKIPKFILASSCSVYGDKLINLEWDNELEPMSPYAAQKVMSEIYCTLYQKLYGLNTYILRFHNVFGLNQNGNNPYSCLIPKFIKKALANASLTIYGDGNQTRDFIDVDSVNEATIFVLDNDTKNNRILNVCSEEEHSVNEVTKYIKELTNSKSEIVHFPPIKGEPRKSVGMNKTLRILGWKQKYTFLEALKKQIEGEKNA